MKVSPEQLRANQDIPIEAVTVPVFGTLTIRGMTGTQRDTFEASCIEGRGRKRDVNVKNLRAKLVVLCTYDAGNTERFFSEGDVSALSEGRADVLDRLYTVGAKLSGISSNDEEELGKPSAMATPSNISSSPSPSNLG